jgi:hypothetical protein
MFFYEISILSNFNEYTYDESFIKEVKFEHLKEEIDQYVKSNNLEFKFEDWFDRIERKTWNFIFLKDNKSIQIKQIYREIA